MTAADISAAGGALKTELEVPVFLFIGDSNRRGSSDNEATVSYTQDSNVLALNASGVFAEYVPRTFTGLSNDANNGSVGAEMEFSRQFRLANPSKPCYIVKYGSSGSGASKLNTGTITGSISGSAFTVTVGSTALGDLIYGTGITTGNVYIASGAGPYTLQQGTLQTVPYFSDPDSSVNLTIASQTFSKANAYLSWKPDDGRNFYLMYRRLTQAFANLSVQGKKPYLAGIFVSLGANDSSDATAAGVYNGAMSSIYRSLKASPYWNSRTIFILDRVPTTGGGASVSTVRSAAATFKGQYRDVRLLDCDAFSKNTADPIHYNLAGLASVGLGEYNLWSGASAGL